MSFDDCNNLMPKPKTIFVTGGAGFIGSALVRLLINTTEYQVVNIDKLSYAGNLASLREISNNSRHMFYQVDICDKRKITELFGQFKPCGLIHLAAESHVDRSIENAAAFIQSNIVGTYTLLECVRHYCVEHTMIDNFRMLHVSTDEVFGALGQIGLFTEETKYDPKSPYSASKASSDFLVRAWHNTYNLPVLISNCTNNYGPYHFPEKLIPLTINHALRLLPLPVYGTGKNIRDWLYVDDHVRALLCIFQHGVIGESYCVGGHNEQTNLEVVTIICNLLDELRPRNDGKSYSELITYVDDRLGHDYRYAMDPTKIITQLGWKPMENFNSGIRKTVEWFLDNQDWVEIVNAKHN